MKTKRSALLLALLPALLTLWSCEKTEMFKSESKIKKQLEGTWNLIPIPRTSPGEIWTFDSNGNVYQSGSAIPNDSGTYEVNTTLMKVQLKLKNLDNIYREHLNTTWDVVLLDENILVIATDRDGASGVMELDFQKGN